MILNPSSFLGRRFNVTVIRSRERLLASSMAYLATFDRSAASLRSGVSDDASELKRSASVARRVKMVCIRVRISILGEENVSRTRCVR